MKVAFLYAGQGSQQVGMGQDFYNNFEIAKNFYDKFPYIRDISFNGDEKTLSQTSNTQPCMLAFDVVVTELLKKEGITPNITAGLSIGEYASLYLADVITSDELIHIGRVRGKAMELSVMGQNTGMCATVGVDEGKLSDICKEHSDDTKKVEIANYNCPGQIVIGGDKDAVGEVASKIKTEKLGKAVLLRVSGAFHTTYMKTAGDILKKEFDNITFNSPKVPVVWNLTGREKTDTEDMKELLVNQVQKPVQFTETINYMLKQGVDTFIEIGFGKVLEGFIKKINKDCTVLSCNSIESFNEVKKFFGK